MGKTKKTRDFHREYARFRTKGADIGARFSPPKIRNPGLQSVCGHPPGSPVFLQKIIDKQSIVRDFATTCQADVSRETNHEHR